MTGKRHVIWENGLGSNVYFTPGLANWLFAQKKSIEANLNPNVYNERTNIKVYLNQETCFLAVSGLKEGQNDLTIFDETGIVRYKTTTNDTNFDIDLSGISKGICILKLNKSYIKKIILK